ncbi:hypothetical protein JB92DRAFT_2836301 [Gautieria morchelliformis]|nr:hypothetical protein JB92DRAFT_2836301 [Gautieria morchelliformis]
MAPWYQVMRDTVPTPEVNMLYLLARHHFRRVIGRPRYLHRGNDEMRGDTAGRCMGVMGWVRVLKWYLVRSVTWIRLHASTPVERLSAPAAPARCTPPPWPDFLLEEDRALDHVGPMPSLGMARTLDDSTTPTQSYPATYGPRLAVCHNLRMSSPLSSAAARLDIALLAAAGPGAFLDWMWIPPVTVLYKYLRRAWLGPTRRLRSGRRIRRRKPIPPRMIGRGIFGATIRRVALCFVGLPPGGVVVVVLRFGAWKWLDLRDTLAGTKGEPFASGSVRDGSEVDRVGRRTGETGCVALDGLGKLEKLGGKMDRRDKCRIWRSGNAALGMGTSRKNCRKAG